MDEKPAKAPGASTARGLPKSLSRPPLHNSKRSTLTSTLGVSGQQASSSSKAVKGGPASSSPSVSSSSVAPSSGVAGSGGSTAGLTSTTHRDPMSSTLTSTTNATPTTIMSLGDYAPPADIGMGGSCMLFGETTEYEKEMVGLTRGEKSVTPPHETSEVAESGSGIGGALRYLIVCGGCRYEGNAPINGIFVYDTWTKRWIQAVSSLTPNNQTTGSSSSPVGSTKASVGSSSFASYPSTPATVGTNTTAPTTNNSLTSPQPAAAPEVFPAFNTATLPLSAYGHCCYATGNSVWIIGGGNNQVLFKTVLTFKVEVHEVPVAPPKRLPPNTSAVNTVFKRKVALISDMTTYPLQHASFLGATCQLTLSGRHSNFVFVLGGMTNGDPSSTGQPQNSENSNGSPLCYTNRCFAVDLDEISLKNIVQTGEVPHPRAAAAMCALGENRLILYGGRDRSGVLDDLYVGTVSTDTYSMIVSVQWCRISRRSVAEVWPGPRVGHDLTVCGPGNSLLILTGGNKIPQKHSPGLSNSKMFILNATGSSISDFAWSELGFAAARNFHKTFSLPTSSVSDSVASTLEPSSPDKASSAQKDEAKRAKSSTSSSSKPGTGGKSASSKAGSEIDNKKKNSDDQGTFDVAKASGDQFLFVCGSSSNPIRYANIDLSSRVISSVPPQLVHFSLSFPKPGEVSLSSPNTLCTPHAKPEVEFTFEKPKEGSSTLNLGTPGVPASKNSGSKPAKKAIHEALSLDSVKKKVYEEFLKKFHSEYYLKQQQGRSKSTTPPVESSSAQDVGSDCDVPSIDDVLLEYDCPCTNERKPLHMNFILEEAVQACATTTTTTTTAGGPSSPTPSSPMPAAASGGATTVASLNIHAFVDNPPNNYIKMKPLGKGSFGEVFMALNQKDSSLFALKSVRVMGESSLETLRREIRMMRQLRHDNIVQYLGSKLDGDEMHIFMDFIAGGDTLEKFCRTVALPIRQVQMYIRQLLHALEFLHRYKIVHRDIKGANVLLSVGGVVKLSDFGTAKHLNPSSLNNQQNSAAGTMVFMAPEVMRSQPCTEAADIWSLGCLVVELVAGAYPYEEMAFQDPLQVIHHVALGSNPPKFPDRMPPAGVSFLKRCFNSDPVKRPAASVLLQDPFVTQLESENVTTAQPATMSRVGSTHYGDDNNGGKGISTTQLFASPQQTAEQTPPRVPVDPTGQHSSTPPSVPSLNVPKVLASRTGRSTRKSIPSSFSKPTSK